MIDEYFTIIGVWIFALIITFLVLGLLTFLINDKTLDFPVSLNIALVIFVVLLELILCTIYIEFKNNPEQYGYTRIEQEVETER